ncbi:hypothetical protein [Paracidovorax valerianellae]|nr:hypothetical protein [Paracidovorax valerianellae]
MRENSFIIHPFVMKNRTSESSLHKALKVALLIFLVLLALMVFSNRDRMDVYGRHFRESSPAVTLRLAELSSTMDEAALKRHFADVPLRCVAEASGPGGLGDRVCYATIGEADGHAALTLANFFREGHLVRTMVHVPWWVHGIWIDRFNAAYGTPRQAGKVSVWGGPVLRWNMSNGYVDFNRDRSFNPLEWNVVLWTAR